jgi:hypothetical protein
MKLKRYEFLVRQTYFPAVIVIILSVIHLLHLVIEWEMIEPESARPKIELLARENRVEFAMP